MKKFIILLCGLSVLTTLCVYSMEFSVSENGSTIKGSAIKQGDYIKMTYRISTPMTPEMKQAMKGSSSYTSSTLNINMSLMASCKEPKMKVLTFNASGLPQEKSMLNTWIPIENQTDYELIQKACSNKL